MMKKAGEFNNILDECLEQVLNKGETLEQCLASYPDYAAELEPLLRTAMVAREASAIEPRREFREKARYQFQAALREMEPKKSRGFFGWQPQWATAVIVVVLLLAGSGTVAASSNSLPDEPLYPVKLATEAVRLTLTPSALGKAELYVKLADKRVAEMIKMADKGKAEQVEKASERLDKYLVAVANLAGSGGEPVVEVSIVTSEAPPAEEASGAQMRQAPVPAPVPAPAPLAETPPPLIQVAPPPAIEEAPPEEETPTLAAPTAPGPSEKAIKAQKGGKAGKGIKTDEQAELKKIVSRRAEENREALQAVLERAPESVKAALRQAIESVGAGYEQVLQHLD